MARQAGYYEWDDDLTPGKKKEGGWHQNLYDTEGRLKGSARFVPVDDDQEDPIVVTETMYVPADERLSKTQEMRCRYNCFRHCQTHRRRRKGSYTACQTVVE